MTAIRNAVQFVEFCENRLGLTLRDNVPLYRARILEAGILKKKIAEDPKKYTWDNLVLAAEFCAKERIRIKTAAGVCFHVDKALRIAAAPEVTSDVDQEIASAIASERAGDAPDRDEWVARLARSWGPTAKHAVLAEWRAARA